MIFHTPESAEKSGLPGFGVTPQRCNLTSFDSLCRSNRRGRKASENSRFPGRLCRPVWPGAGVRTRPLSCFRIPRPVGAVSSPKGQIAQARRNRLLRKQRRASCAAGLHRPFIAVILSGAQRIRRIRIPVPSRFTRSGENGFFTSFRMTGTVRFRFPATRSDVASAGRKGYVPTPPGKSPHRATTGLWRTNAGVCCFLVAQVEQVPIFETGQEIAGVPPHRSLPAPGGTQVEQRTACSTCAPPVGHLGDSSFHGSGTAESETGQGIAGRCTTWDTSCGVEGASARAASFSAGPSAISRALSL